MPFELMVSSIKGKSKRGIVTAVVSLPCARRPLSGSSGTCCSNRSDVGNGRLCAARARGRQLIVGKQVVIDYHMLLFSPTQYVANNSWGKIHSSSASTVFRTPRSKTLPSLAWPINDVWLRCALGFVPDMIINHPPQTDIGWRR